MNPPVESFFDGVFAGLGYTIVLVIIAFIRELLGFGTILGFNVNFVGFETWTIMVMPPAAFFLVGVMIWIVNNIMARKQASGGGKRG